MANEIELFFFPCSTYSYLTVMRIERDTAGSGVKIRWRPFNVRQIMVEMHNIPFATKPVKERYMWRDIERRAARHGLPFVGKPPYPADPDLQALRATTEAAQEGWCPEFAKASYQSWFLHGKAPGVGQNTRDVIAELGRDPDAVLARAMTEEVGQLVEQATDDARRLGIFGSPTFVVGEEIFWGDDRMEDAFQWARAASAEN